MKEHSEKYIERCKEIGILTSESIRKYPLRSTNLAIVLKAYAVATHQPYQLTNEYDVLSDHVLYLTPSGFDWLIHFFSERSLAYLKSTFRFVFIKASNEETVIDPEFEGYSNFRGDTGKKPKAGSKQGAVLVRTYGPSKNKRTQEFKFDTLHEARSEVIRFTRFYPVDQFTLYRIRKNTKKGKVSYYRSKVPLFLEENNRGKVINLPNVRR